MGRVPLLALVFYLAVLILALVSTVFSHLLVAASFFPPTPPADLVPSRRVRPRRVRRGCVPFFRKGFSDSSEMRSKKHILETHRCKLRVTTSIALATCGGGGVLCITAAAAAYGVPGI